MAFSAVFIIPLFLLNSSNSYADAISQARTKFYHGNTYYSQSEYDKAIAEYEETLASGFASGNLYYNLGNSYFKKAELGRAILNYEKAMRLIPRDSDLKSNYTYAKSLVKRTAPEREESWGKRVFYKWNSFFSIDEIAFYLSVIFTAILVIILTAAYIPSIRKYRFSALVSLIIIFILFFISMLEKLSIAGKEAIVIAENIDARFEPFDSATAYFTLYEGAKVSVVMSRGSWYKIERSDKKTGWVPAKGIEIF